MPQAYELFVSDEELGLVVKLARDLVAPTRRNISLKAQSKAALAEFEQSIVDCDEVMECYLAG